MLGFLTIDELPPGIVSFTPHLTTLLVLSLASQRLRMPKADGLVYRRGEQLVSAMPDWDALRAAAREAMTHAYAPYSKFPVGVAGLVDDGRVVTGCNVENASYGLGLCAECGMVSDLARTGGGRLVAVACVGGDGQPLMPCGRCRQLLWEHGGADMLIETVSLGHRADARGAAGRLRPRGPASAAAGRG